MRRMSFVLLAVVVIAAAGALWSVREGAAARRGTGPGYGVHMPPPPISVEEAQRRATAWAKWVREPLVYRPGQDDKHVRRLAYVFETASGRDHVAIDSRMGERLYWESPALVAEADAHRKQVEGGLPPKADTERACRDFMGRWCEGGVGRFTGTYARWTDAGADGTDPEGRVRQFRLDAVTCAVCSFTETTRALKMAPQARVSPGKARRIAHRALSKWPFRRIRELEGLSAPGTPGGKGGAAQVSDDMLGLQRMAYSFAATLYPAGMFTQWQWRRRSQDTVDETECSSAVLCVDAHTGEPIDVLDGVRGWGITALGGETWPHAYVDDKQAELSYPPRIRRDLPYMYVGYLATWLWPGQVTERGRSADVQYAGRAWIFVTRSRNAVCDGRTYRFEHAPIGVGGRIYLPPDMFYAITGWKAEYQHISEDRVYINAPEPPPGAAPASPTSASLVRPVFR